MGHVASFGLIPLGFMFAGIVGVTHVTVRAKIALDWHPQSIKLRLVDCDVPDPGPRLQGLGLAQGVMPGD